MRGIVVEARTHEGEQLVGVVVRYLIGCYRSIDPQFSLSLALAGASKGAEDTTKGDPKVDTVVAKVTPWFRCA
jgi:hypothetical protein